MLILGSRLINTPVMGLQTGTKLAQTKRSIINPGNLGIVAYELEGSMLTEHPSFLRIADVRELSPIGMIVDSSDEFIGLEDVIAVKKIIDLNFNIVGYNVIDEMGHKLGKVTDYSVDTDSFTIQQLTVKRGFFRSLAETELLIHRSQIVEINDQNIIVKATAKKLEPVITKEKLDYINPFRTAKPQADGVSMSKNTY